MKPAIVKGIIGTIGVGGVVVGGYYGSGSLFPPKIPAEKPKASIRNLITNTGRTVLNNQSNNGLWGIKLNTYELLFKSPKKINLETEDEEGLKKWCDDATKKETEDKNDNDYSIAQQLCTRPTNRETLQKKSKTLADDQDWERKAEEYKAAGTANVITEIKNRSEATPQQIKNWCEKTWDEEILEIEDTYNLAVKWCTKEGQ
ncbi:hypothetical protein A6V39_00335 [Candidatus Mycoplasma haematobovis]|uniref:Uncharacterized protein n=1 Tax=Candidatus Mycoplasma haematobovis TaxID=432608 RepID=A0A1A9QDE2_9MOLU|nr:hypothetical protein [Candidatus Mycoplasma haematobovis]OAL10497.1 hypothetical protein A6V39_00335 [Candidatus Mycoplasma haematobovis]